MNHVAWELLNRNSRTKLTDASAWGLPLFSFKYYPLDREIVTSFLCPKCAHLALSLSQFFLKSEQFGVVSLHGLE